LLLTGEYNCFLNVIIQCLWHSENLREQLDRHLLDYEVRSHGW
jgi:hypothetical protein